MKSHPFIQSFLGLAVLPLLAFCLTLLPAQIHAQEEGIAGSPETYSREELAQMLAPVALYPDALLAQVLMASTYPIEVVEADRWIRSNPGLTGEALDRALLDKGWDPSVKAICHFPSVLAMMSDNIAQTTDLGNAFLAQDDEVMDMVQELRAEAYARGNLNSTAEQKVMVRSGGTIVIEPVNPRVVYVPYYDPFYVYGPWWYPAYPPYYWGPVGVSLGFGISFWPGIYFGFSFGSWSYFDWHHHHIYLHHDHRPRFTRHDHWISRSGPWHHAPAHRRGLAYRDHYISGKYGQPYRHSDGIRGIPVRSEQVRSGDGRVVGERVRRTDGDARFERSRQEQQRVERELQKRRSSERTGQLRQDQSVRDNRSRGDRDRDRFERLRKEQPVADRPKRDQDRNRVERPRQDRSGGAALPAQRLEQRERPARQQVETERTERRSQQRVERARPERSRENRENVFRRGDSGRSDLHSSKRGGFMRQEPNRSNRSGDFRPSGGNRGGQHNWSRDRR